MPEETSENSEKIKITATKTRVTVEKEELVIEGPAKEIVVIMDSIGRVQTRTILSENKSNYIRQRISDLPEGTAEKFRGRGFDSFYTKKEKIVIMDRIGRIQRREILSENKSNYTEYKISHLPAKMAKKFRNHGFDRVYIKGENSEAILPYLSGSRNYYGLFTDDYRDSPLYTLFDVKEDITEHTEMAELEEVDEIPSEYVEEASEEPEIPSDSGHRYGQSAIRQSLAKINLVNTDYIPGGMGTWRDGLRLLRDEIKPKSVRQRADILGVLDDISKYDLDQLREAKEYLSDKCNRERIMTNTLYLSNNPQVTDDYQASLDAKIQFAEIENTVNSALKAKEKEMGIYKSFLDRLFNR